MPSWYPILLFQPLRLIKNCAFLASDSFLPAIKCHQVLHQPLKLIKKCVFVVSDFVVSADKVISRTVPSWHLILSYQPLNFIKNCAFVVSDFGVSAVKVNQELCLLCIRFFLSSHLISSRTVPFWHPTPLCQSLKLIKNCAFLASDSFLPTIKFHQELYLPGMRLCCISR